MCPSRETWNAPPGEKGDTTEATSGSDASRVASASMSARSAPEATGAAVFSTTWALSPAAEGNRDCRRSRACWDGTLPDVNLFSNRVPISWAAAVAPTSTTIQVRRTRRRRR